MEEVKQQILTIRRNKELIHKEIIAKAKLEERIIQEQIL